jgi:hypothetical protein
MSRKIIESNYSLRRRPKVLGLHPTIALAITFIAVVVFVVFYAAEWDATAGWAIFVVLSGTVYASAPNGLGDLIARMIKPPRLTRGCTFYESPLNVQSQGKKAKKIT